MTEFIPGSMFGHFAVRHLVRDGVAYGYQVVHVASGEDIGPAFSERWESDVFASGCEVYGASIGGLDTSNPKV